MDAPLTRRGPLPPANLPPSAPPRAQLVSHCATRSSRKFHLANTLVDGLLRPEDEQVRAHGLLLQFSPVLAFPPHCSPSPPTK